MFGLWSRAPLLFVLLLLSTRAKAQDGAVDTGTTEEARAAELPVRPARAVAPWSISLGAAVEELAFGFTVRFAYGFVPVERLRIDARAWLAGPFHDSFSTAGMTFNDGTSPADHPSGDLRIMRAGIEIAAALRAKHLEPRLALGWTFASAEAETTYTVDALFLGTWQNTASAYGDGNGPCVAAGVDVVLTDRVLLGFEIRKPFLAAVQLREVPLRVELDSFSASGALTVRWGS